MKKAAISLLVALALVFSLVLVAAPAAQAASTHPHDNAAAGYTHCTCGGDAVGVGDHVCLSAGDQGAITWIDLNSVAVVTDQNDANYGKANDYTLGDGEATDYYYYLSGDLETVARFTFAGEKNITICMNGYKIFSEKTDVNGRIFNMTSKGAGTTVNLCDCGTGGKVETKAVIHGALIFLQNAKHTFNLFDVALEASNQKVAPDETYGLTGAVTLAWNPGNTFNMYGGSITGGQTTGNGGNVLVNVGTMNMYGGVIKDGVAEGKGANIYCDGTLNIDGGSVIGGKPGAATCDICVPMALSLKIKNLDASTTLHIVDGSAFKTTDMDSSLTLEGTGKDLKLVKAGSTAVNPGTGDSANLAVMGLGLVLGVAGMACLLPKKQKV